MNKGNSNRINADELTTFRLWQGEEQHPGSVRAESTYGNRSVLKNASHFQTKWKPVSTYMHVEQYSTKKK